MLCTDSLLADRTRRTVIASLMFAASLVLPTGARACSRVVQHIPGTLTEDGSVVYVVRVGGDEQPSLRRLAHYTSAGAPTGTLDFDLGIVDGSAHIQGIDKAGHAWLLTRCWYHPESDLCDRLVQLTPTGDVAHSLPLGEYPPRFDPVRGRFLEGFFAESRLTLTHPYTEDRDEPLLTFELPEAFPMSSYTDPYWAVDAEGSAVIVVQEREQVTFLRYRANGELRTFSHFPRARRGRAFDDSQDVRLGDVTGMALADDGTVFAAQYALASDCEVYQPPSVAILDRENNLVNVAPVDDTIHMLRVIDDELVVLQHDGKVFRLTHDGLPIESWTPDLGPWQQQREGTIEERQQRAAAATRSDGPEVWLEVYPMADMDQRQRIEGWLVDAGPKALEDATDQRWQRLGPKLCERHPEAASLEALRRFARSRGVNKARWLEVLVACFEQPPAEAYAYAQAIADRDHPYDDAAEKALRAWGYSRARLDTLWQATLAEPDREAGQSLLRAFDQLADDFDDRLRHAPEAERRIVRQMLFETLQSSDQFLFGSEEARARARSRLIPCARDWTASPDLFVAATGRLLLVGHHEVAASDVWPELAADAEQDSSLRPWLAYTLGQVVSKTDPPSLPRPALDKLVGWALDAPSGTEIELRSSWMTIYDPYHWLFELDGDPALRRLYARALEPEGSSDVRQRLLQRLYQQPWRLDPAALERLLKAPWLGHRWHFQQSTGFLVRLNQLISDLEVPLRQILWTRFRQLFLTAAANRHPVPIGGQPHDDKSALLRQALTIDDVAGLIDQTPDGLRTWLWLVAAVGAWPEIESELESLLSETQHAVSAAVALAPQGHPEALNVLLRQGLHWQRAPADAFAPYGEAARQHLIPLVFHDEWRARGTARRSLRAVGADPATLDKLAAEVAESLAEDELPDFHTAMLVLDADPGLMPELLGPLMAKAEEGYLDDYGHDLEFARAVARWAEVHPLRQGTLRDLWAHLNNLASPPALDWREALATTAKPTE